MKKQQANSFLNNKAFTLVETLVVVLILGILASIALPEYRKSVQIARAAEIGPNMKAMEQAINVYLDEEGFASAVFIGTGVNTNLIVNTKPMQDNPYYTYEASCTTSQCVISAVKYKKNTTTKAFEVKFTRASDEKRWTKQCTSYQAVDKSAPGVCNYLKNSKLVTTHTES